MRSKSPRINRREKKEKGLGLLKKKKRSYVVLPGIEPGLARPQRDVLPLDQSTFVLYLEL